MEEQLVGFELAKLAKEKGFNWKVYAFYKIPSEESDYKEGELVYSGNDWGTNEDYLDIIIDFNSAKVCYYKDKEYVSAPTQSLLQKWLRKIHEIDIYSTWGTYYDNTDWRYYISEIGKKSSESSVKNYQTYEEVLEVGLLEALKLIK